MNFKWGLTTFLYAMVSYKYVAKIRGYQRVVEGIRSDRIDEEETAKRNDGNLEDVKEEIGEA